MKERIFLFVPQMGYGGQERFVSRLSSILNDDYQIYIVLLDKRTINFPLSGEILNINSPSLPANTLKKICEEIKRIIRFRWLLRKYKPKVCFSFGEGANIINLIGKKRCTAVYTSIRGFANAEIIKSSKLRQRLYSRSDRIICVSQGIKSSLSNVACLKEKLCVLYNAYDCDSIYADSQKSDEEREKKSGPSIVSVGTLRKEKGYWHIIKAIANLKKKYDNIHLTIVGEDNPPNLCRLKQLVTDLDVASNVSFEGWNANPYQFISQADIYVLSSVREGFPNALVEGMACRRAVIANDCLTGPKEILCKNFENITIDGYYLSDYGVLVERMADYEDYSTNITKDDMNLAMAIDRLLSDDIMRQYYEEKAYKRATEFSYESCRRHFVDMIMNKI